MREASTLKRNCLGPKVGAWAHGDPGKMAGCAGAVPRRSDEQWGRWLLSLSEKTSKRTGCCATSSVSVRGYARAIVDPAESPVRSEVLRRIALPQTETTRHW
ncbi:hypothetical protein NDU88_002410 [Pleurodeles waltl]|uniref:Uncharacterized protein n=1 Tax=Pleurodeles waltl TaxID=8319 RepID=A0AAV7PDY4_PLEWA|nr:hypothetical protein NDU88_002410 [Pleurodeles waltl]